MFFSSTVMLMKGGYCRLKNLTHRNSQTLATLHLMHSAFFIARHEMTIWAEYIPGVQNQSAYALSRNDRQSLLLQNPGLQHSLSRHMFCDAHQIAPHWTGLNYWGLFMKSLAEWTQRVHRYIKFSTSVG